VEVHYDEDVASHVGPEPCGVTREDGGEASVGECAGQPLSRERMFIPSADAVNWAEGNMEGCAMQVPSQLGVVGDPGMCRSSLRGNREVPRLAERQRRRSPHRESEEP
jgi:hypothetical protein